VERPLKSREAVEEGNNPVCFDLTWPLRYETVGNREAGESGDAAA
jgi:hypothetical protein